jgi:hypothetical protein
VNSSLVFNVLHTRIPAIVLAPSYALLGSTLAGWLAFCGLELYYRLSSRARERLGWNVPFLYLLDGKFSVGVSVLLEVGIGLLCGLMYAFFAPDGMVWTEWSLEDSLSFMDDQSGGSLEEDERDSVAVVQEVFMLVLAGGMGAVMVGAFTCVAQMLALQKEEKKNTNTTSSLQATGVLGGMIEDDML